MNSEPIDQSTRCIGQSLLPKGWELSGYVKHIQEKIKFALSDHDIKISEYMMAWLISECLNVAGWKTNTKSSCARIVAKDITAIHISNVDYLLLDDGTTVSPEGWVGLENIKRETDQCIRDRFRDEAKSPEANSVLPLAYLAAPTLWIDEENEWRAEYFKGLIDSFHPSVHHIVQSVAAAMIAENLSASTMTQPRCSIKTRL